MIDSESMGLRLYSYLVQFRTMVARALANVGFLLERRICSRDETFSFASFVCWNILNASRDRFDLILARRR